jgi:hypothetical protein
MAVVNVVSGCETYHSTNTQRNDADGKGNKSGGDQLPEGVPVSKM